VMVIKLDRKVLEECLLFLNRIITRTKALELGVQFLFKNNSLKLYGSNGSQICEVTYGTVECLNFNCLLEFSVLNKIVSLSDDAVLECSFDVDRLSVVSGRNEYEFMYLLLRDYSATMEAIKTDEDPIAVIPIVEMQTALHFLMACLPVVAGLNHFRGINYDGNFTATNTHGFVYWKLNLPKVESLFIALESFQLLASLDLKGKSAVFYRNDNCLVAVADRARYLILLMANPFPKYDKIIQRIGKHDRRITLSKDGFIKSCKKLTPFTDSFKRNSAKLYIAGAEMTISVESETKKAKEVLPVTTNNISDSVAFNVNLIDLQSYATRASSATIDITFSESLEDYAIRDADSWYLDRTLTS